jgi:arachidonate 15-lipoxygenase
VPDLGALAMAGPYWGYLVKTGSDAWQWDFSELGQFEHLPGLCNLGVRVRFGRDLTGRKPQATEIECELGTITPAHPKWRLAVELALCAITTHMSLVRHFNAIHLAFGAKFSQATRNRLPTDHPLFRLVWPHIHDTQFSNELVTLAQLSPNGDFPAIFSFTYEGLCKLFEETHQRLELSSFDSELDARKRGESDSGLDTPGLDNMKRIFAVILQHVTRYVAAYYGSEGALLADPAVRLWLEEMNARMPNGIAQTLGVLSRATLSRFIAVLINVVVVEHALRDASPWNYVLWTDRAPIRVYTNGQREPLDVYQRHVNANMLFQLRRTLLTKNFSYLALDERGAQLFREFRESLIALQATIADEPPQPWKLHPVQLNANMNA